MLYRSKAGWDENSETTGKFFGVSSLEFLADSWELLVLSAQVPQTSFQMWIILSLKKEKVILKKIFLHIEISWYIGLEIYAWNGEESRKLDMYINRKSTSHNNGPFPLKGF